jgi:hypothetical protein
MIDDAIILFSFGYWGWGNSTTQLVRAFDALEQCRGFKPPLLVDIRISRSVRAPGFNNRALEQLVGTDRYVHIPELGNLAVIEKTREPVTIANPKAAGSLLDLAISEHTRNGRLVFFCACPFQMKDGKPSCHRYEVGSLLLEESRKRKQPVVVSEWPGIPRQVLKLALPTEVLKKLRRGMKSLPLPRDLPVAEIAAIAWGSLVRCIGDGEQVNARVDRARWSVSGWYLPVLDLVGDGVGAASDREARAWGFVERTPSQVHYGQY